MSNLTEQWKKGELPEGVYYCNTGYTVETLFTWGKNYHQLTNNKDEVYIPEMDDCEIIAPVPSYEEWKQKDKAMTALLAEYGKVSRELQEEKVKHMTRPSLRSPADEMVIEKQVWESTLNRSMKLQAENAQLKELMKECQGSIATLLAKRITEVNGIKQEELLTKIYEVLK